MRLLEDNKRRELQERVITLTENRYQAGQGTVTVQIRGDDTTIFTQDAANPAWGNYTTPVAKTWRYIQMRVIKQT